MSRPREGQACIDYTLASTRARGLELRSLFNRVRTVLARLDASVFAASATVLTLQPWFRGPLVALRGFRSLALATVAFFIDRS